MSRGPADALVAAASRSTVDGVFRCAARTWPGRAAVVEGERALTYRELDRLVDHVAGWLAARGIGRGDRVAILSENSASYVAVMLACARVGCILACQNWRLTARELRHCIALVEPKMVLVSDRFAALLDEVDDGGGGSASGGAPRFRLDAALAARWAEAEPLAPLSPADAGANANPGTEAGGGLDPEAILFILYTSGTTGLPKGAAISHRAEIVRNLAWHLSFGIRPGDTMVVWMPLYHMGGADQALGTLLGGGKVIVMEGFDAPRIARIAAREPLGWLITMPGTTDRMISAIKAEPSPPVGVRAVGVMPDLVPRAEIAELTALVDAPYPNTFGSTETGSPPCSGSCLPIGVVPERLSKQLSPFCELRLVDPDGNDVPDGTPGEAAVRGPTLFSGYWRADETNAKDFRGGWFHMGDLLVRREDGTFDFVDRAKYMIKSGGENIYPAEIEQVLLTDPRVAEAAVVRRTDPRWGEVPVAFVARRDGAPLEDADLYRRCRTELAGYKQPKGIRFIGFDDFPRSASGKVQRHELESRLAEEAAAQEAAAGGEGIGREAGGS